LPGSPYQNKNGTIGGGAHSNLYSSEHMSDGGMNIGGRSGSESIDFMNTFTTTSTTNIHTTITHMF
jgi:hypothetical protein